MQNKNIIIRIFNCIKKIYLLPFNFMIGKEKRKYMRFFTHVFAIMWWVVIVPGVVYNIIQFLIGNIARENVFYSVVMQILAAIIWPCFVKLMLIVSRYFPDWT